MQIKQKFCQNQTFVLAILTGVRHIFELDFIDIDFDIKEVKSTNIQQVFVMWKRSRSNASQGLPWAERNAFYLDLIFFLATKMFLGNLNTS